MLDHRSWLPLWDLTGLAFHVNVVLARDVVEEVCTLLVKDSSNDGLGVLATVFGLVRNILDQRIASYSMNLAFSS